MGRDKGEGFVRRSLHVRPVVRTWIALTPKTFGYFNGTGTTETIPKRLASSRILSFYEQAFERGLIQTSCTVELSRRSSSSGKDVRFRRLPEGISAAGSPAYAHRCMHMQCSSRQISDASVRSQSDWLALSQVLEESNVWPEVELKYQGFARGKLPKEQEVAERV